MALRDRHHKECKFCGAKLSPASSYGKLKRCSDCNSVMSKLYDIMKEEKSGNRNIETVTNKHINIAIKRLAAIISLKEKIWQKNKTVIEAMNIYVEKLEWLRGVLADAGLDYVNDKQVRRDVK